MIFMSIGVKRCLFYTSNEISYSIKNDPNVKIIIVITITCSKFNDEDTNEKVMIPNIMVEIMEGDQDVSRYVGRTIKPIMEETTNGVVNSIL